MKTKHIAGIGMMIAVAFVLGYLESLIPLSFGIPGIKLGLSNLVVMLSLYSFSLRTTFGIAVVRILLTGLTFGNLYNMAYSLAGGLLSFAVMAVLKSTGKFSVYGVSMAGGVCHNMGQIIVASLVLQTSLLVYYLPFLLIAGVLAGLGIGAVSGLLLQRLQKTGVLDEMFASDDQSSG